MPLSKARDRDRKKRERARIRLEKAISSSQTSKPVQPKPILDAGPYWGNYGGRDYHPDIDADGNVIPDYD